MKAIVAESKSDTIVWQDYQAARNQTTGEGLGISVVLDAAT
jgi:hypothetical protein